eukprot:TRINITY_DN3144_c0_g3_i1.p1 TRINITY_DN3144_c0_g3~~TRINITY_DN3144_c0_g3_i1.p1  ORF type:complete len:150 (-),score=35.82 TRINITY_DN3144_c0_g3_i1:105-554(-)
MGYGGKGKVAGKSWTSPIQSWGKGGQTYGKGFGGGCGSGFGYDRFAGAGGFGGGFGMKGKGKGKQRADPATTAWIGGLPENEASVERNKALLEHMKQAGNCKFVKIGNSGTGSAGFTSAEEVETAISVLNGSDFQGHVIQVDYWTKKDA